MQANGALGVHRGGVLQKRLLSAGSCCARESPIQLCWTGSPWAMASVRLPDAAETDPTRPLLVELHQMLSESWMGQCTAYPFYTNPPTSNPDRPLRETSCETRTT